MEALKFKTNIKCGGCIAQVTPALNKAVGANNWEVDIQNPEKILTVSGEVSESEVTKAVKEAGFEVERI